MIEIRPNGKAKSLIMPEAAVNFVQMISATRIAVTSQTNSLLSIYDVDAQTGERALISTADIGGVFSGVPVGGK